MKKKQVKDNTPDIKLSHRQRLFADGILAGKSYKASAETAGYAPGRAAEVAGNRLMKNPKVKAYIDSRAQKIYDKYEITQDKVMRTYAVLAWYDPRKFYHEDGSLKPITELDDDTVMALLGIEVETAKITKGVKTTTKTQTTKIKISDRKAALDSICKVKGWNAPDKVDHTTKGESLNQVPDLSGLTDEELRLLAKIKRKMNVERI